MGVSWHGLTWILLGRLGGGIVVLRTKYRDVPMGIDSTRLGWMGVLRRKAWIDPSMSALPIIVKQNSPSVGLFTHQ